MDGVNKKLREATFFFRKPNIAMEIPGGSRALAATAQRTRGSASSQPLTDRKLCPCSSYPATPGVYR